MPYIPQDNRDKFHKMLARLPKIDNPGELNYLISCIMQWYVVNNGKCYQSFNDMMGALEGAKLELYRRDIAEYENLKRDQNGDIK